MPNGNGMGPIGTGPMTGRGAGNCAGNSSPGSQNNGGKGMQRGFFRNHAQHAVAAADAMLLEEKISALQAQLASLEQQLANLNSKDAD